MPNVKVKRRKISNAAWAKRKAALQRYSDAFRQERLEGRWGRR